MYFTTIHAFHFRGIANHSLTGRNIAKPAASFFSIIAEEENNAAVGPVDSQSMFYLVI